MKKLVIIGSMALVVFLSSCSNNKQTGSADSVSTDSVAATDPATAPVMKFEEESFEFGKVKDGEKVSHDFKFVNTGKTPLIISNATATCGCTVPEYPKEPIAPGESAAIKVVFDTAGKEGMQRKVVTITSNANPSTSEVYVIGEVLPKTQ